MPVICKTSVERAKQRFAAATGKPIKVLMGEVVDAYEPSEGDSTFDANTMARFIRDERNLTDARASAICAAFKSCGYEIALAGKQIEDHIFADTFFAFTPHLTPVGGGNRVEPDTPDQQTALNARYTVGYHMVTFSAAEGEHEVFTARFVPQSLIIDVHFNEAVRRDSAADDDLMPLTHEDIATQFSWSLPNLTVGLGAADFGGFTGTFTHADRIAVYVDPLELKPTKIEDILGEPVKQGEKTTEFLERVQKEKAAVLEGAMKRQTGTSRRIAQKGLLPHE